MPAHSSTPRKSVRRANSSSNSLLNKRARRDAVRARRATTCRHFVRVRFNGSLPDFPNALRDPEQFLADPTLERGQLTAEDPAHPDSPAMGWSTP
jgi:hypothetical protein